MQQQREDFIAKLVAGDKRANEIWDAVNTIVNSAGKDKTH
jgi:hypothetical protein